MTFLENSIETCLDKWKRVKIMILHIKKTIWFPNIEKKKDNAPKFADRNIILSIIVLILQ